MTTPAGTTTHIEGKEEQPLAGRLAAAGATTSSATVAAGAARPASPSERARARSPPRTGAATQVKQEAGAAKPAAGGAASRPATGASGGAGATQAATGGATAERTSGANTPNAANALANAANQPAAPAAQLPRGQPAQQRHYMLEFNHAITFVNKIKTRYNTDTETYKQFLEILQTYQRDGREITEVGSASLCLSMVGHGQHS